MGIHHRVRRTKEWWPQIARGASYLRTSKHGRAGWELVPAGPCEVLLINMGKNRSAQQQATCSLRASGVDMQCTGRENRRPIHCSPRRLPRDARVVAQRWHNPCTTRSLATPIGHSDCRSPAPLASGLVLHGSLQKGGDMFWRVATTWRHVKLLRCARWRCRLLRVECGEESEKEVQRRKDFGEQHGTGGRRG
jgi:hypothetical protein